MYKLYNIFERNSTIFQNRYCKNRINISLISGRILKLSINLYPANIILYLLLSIPVKDFKAVSNAFCCSFSATFSQGLSTVK